MAKSHDRNSAAVTGTPEAGALLAAVEIFLSGCRRPAALEYGEEALPLLPDQYALETRSGRLWIEIWTDSRSVSRRILSIERQTPGVLDCAVQRFGGKPGKLSFLDLDRPQTAHKFLSGERQHFAEQFRRMLTRQLPGWDIASISCGLDLQHCFSSTYPRARLIRGNRQIAAMACPTATDEADMLGFALIWFDHVRAHAESGTYTSLSLFFPEKAGALTAHRLRWLNATLLNPHLFRFNEHGSAGEVDPHDLGNVETRVSPHFRGPELTEDLTALLKRLREIEGVACCPELNGAVGIRCRGLEFARIENGDLTLGIEERRNVRDIHDGEVERFAEELSRLGEGNNAAIRRFPERWLESAVRANIAAIDATLITDPIHSQVLTFAAGDRDLIDLLAVSPAGRLAIIELKAEEDIHLPLQALDYWIRICWHLQRNELQHLFPGIALTSEAPKLLLVAPATVFHSSNPTILRYFSPEIPVERIGINSGWQHNLKVVLRLPGASMPMSHEISK